MVERVMREREIAVETIGFSNGAISAKTFGFRYYQLG